MFRKLSIFSVMFLVTACATQTPVASKTNLDTAEKVASEKKDEPTLICKRTHTVGTNFKKKQCWTKEEYAEEQRLSKEALERSRRSGMTAPEGR